MLTIENIHVYYGNIAAVHGLSMTVDAGEIVTLLGSNGAGKSTTLRTISGLLRPRRGSVLFEGRRLDGVPAHEVVGRGITQSPEGRRIFPRLTVGENLDLGAYLRRDKAAIAADKDERAGAVPAAAGTDRPEGRHHVRRRAADARGGPGADGPAAGCCCWTSRRWGWPRCWST